MGERRNTQGPQGRRFGAVVAETWTSAYISESPQPHPHPCLPACQEDSLHAKRVQVHCQVLRFTMNL